MAELALNAKKATFLKYAKRVWALILGVAAAMCVLGIGSIATIEFVIGEDSGGIIGTILSKVWIPLITIGILLGAVSVFALIQHIRRAWIRGVLALLLSFVGWFFLNPGFSIRPYSTIFESFGFACLLLGILVLLSIPVVWIAGIVRRRRVL